jgi:hypothetical protein
MNVLLRRNQHGFSHLLLPLGLLVIVFVGAVGYRVYRGVSAETLPTPGSLYSYDFRSSTVTSPVPNGATTNTAVPLNLIGTWSKSAFGIHFAGDTKSGASVAYAQPKSGNVLSVAANQAMGGAIMFKYEGPSAGTGCLGDSRNLTQIGRFSAGAAQFKIQYSNCGTSSSNVFPECRIAGAKSSDTVALARSTQALTSGETYIIQCVKSPDTATNTTVQLNVTHVDAISGNQVTNNTNVIPAAGAMTTTSALSVGNKYPLPAQSANTDQFVGDIAKVAYCGGATTDAVTTCLNTEVPVSSSSSTGSPTPTPTPDPSPAPTPDPAPAPAPATQEFVTNPSFEADLSGWTGVETATSLNTRVAGGYDQAYSLRSVNNSSTAANNGFISKPSWLDGSAGKATVAGKVYSGSVWIKPDYVGQKFNLYLREISPSNTTVGSKTTTLTAASTNWQKLTNDYMAKGSGNSLSFHVFTTSAAARSGFNADALSLTTTN